MNAPALYIKRVDSVYHCAFLCYYWMWKSAICVYKQTFPLVGFIYNSLLGLVQSYLCIYMCKNYNQYSLRCHNAMQISCPENQKRTGKKAFKWKAVPVSWNSLQEELKLAEMVTMGEFRSILKEWENNSFSQCYCF